MSKDSMTKDDNKNEQPNENSLDYHLNRETTKMDSSKDKKLMDNQTTSKVRTKAFILTIVTIIGLLFIYIYNLDMSAPKTPINIISNEPVIYAKDNKIYVYDLKNLPYAVDGEITYDGGFYNHYFFGMGNNISKDGKKIIYEVNLGIDGSFDIYSKSTSFDKEDAALVSEDVYEYKVSDSGKEVIYIKESNAGNLELRGNDLDGDYLLSNLGQSLGAYTEITSDGKKVIFLNMADIDSGLYVSDLHGDNLLLIDKSVLEFKISVDNKKVMYSTYGGTGEIYDLYSYSIETTDKLLIAENVFKYEFSEHGNSVLYLLDSNKGVNYSDILVNDIQNSETYKNILSQVQDNIIKHYTADVYLYKNNNTIEIAKDVLDAKLVGYNGEYVIYTDLIVNDNIKVNMSEINSGFSLDDIADIYYSKLFDYSLGKLYDTYFVVPKKEPVLIETGYSDISTVIMSSDGKKVMFMSDLDIDGVGTLMVVSIKNGDIYSYAEYDKNVEKAYFSNMGNDIAYIVRETEDRRVLNYVSGIHKAEIADSVDYFVFADDTQYMYYIDTTDFNTGEGNLIMFNKGEEIKIDEKVMFMFYLSDKSLVYIKDYDFTTNKGDLYYLKNTNIKLLDEGVTAVFNQ